MTLTNVRWLFALLLELHLAGDLREQRVVGADAYAIAGAHRRATLPHQDVAGQHMLAAKLLHAQTLAVGIAAVTGTAACFLVCHVLLAPLESSGDVRDLHQRELLAMIARALVVLAATELDDNFLLALPVAFDSGADLAARQVRRADPDVGAIGDQQHFARTARSNPARRRASRS